MATTSASPTSYQALRLSTTQALVAGGGFSATEAGYLAKLLLTHRLQLTEAALIARQTLSWSAEDADWLAASVLRLCKQEPWQYVLGTAPFLELELAVRPGVLIPRPETEELVMLALDQVSKRFSAQDELVFWDACTGSGCMALALKHRHPTAAVWATDLSDEALTIATENAERLGLGLRLVKHDLLADPTPMAPKSVHLLMSNPPYVLPSEAEQMAPNVLAYEPAMALFTPQEDPLLFYRALVAHASHCLHPEGVFVLECNEAYTDAVAGLFKAAGFVPRTISDFRGRMRGVWGEIKSLN